MTLSSNIDSKMLFFMKMKNHVEYDLEFMENNFYQITSSIKDPLVSFFLY